MKKVITHVLLVSTLMVAGCSLNQLRLKEYSSAAGNFSITAPGALKETTQSVNTPVGPIEIHTFTTENKNSAYVVAYSDYPAGVVEQSDPKLLLDSSRDGAINNLGGTLVSEEVIDLEGNPGRSLVINTTTETGDPATINSRIYLVKNRLYQILVVTPEKDANPANSTAFLDSFELQ